jgi:osmoprotectant transport system substrate-binding protein
LGEAYGFELAKDKVATLDFGLVYASVAKGDPCNAAVVFATDGQIQANSLTVLEDDKGFFPAYNIALTMKTELYDAHPAEFDEFFGELNELLTTEQMQELNAAVDVEGQEVEAVVDGFLEENNVV